VSFRRPGAVRGQHVVRAVAVLLGVVAPFAARPALGADLAPLVESLRSDPAFKVRLQAARILRRRAEEPRVEVGPVVRALAQAARSDPNALVRAYAIRACGDLAGPSEAELFDRVIASDAAAFVREQARAGRKAWQRRMSSRPVLVLDADPWVLNDGSDRTDTLKASLRRAAESVAEGRFRVGAREAEAGYLARATVTELERRPEGERHAVRLELKLVLATWPEKNLRHVVTARASARVSPAGDDASLWARLVKHATKQALADALAQIR